MYNPELNDWIKSLDKVKSLQKGIDSTGYRISKWYEKIAMVSGGLASKGSELHKFSKAIQAASEGTQGTKAEREMQLKALTNRSKILTATHRRISGLSFAQEDENSEDVGTVRKYAQLSKVVGIEPEKLRKMGYENLNKLVQTHAKDMKQASKSAMLEKDAFQGTIKYAGALEKTTAGLSGYMRGAAGDAGGIADGLMGAMEAGEYAAGSFFIVAAGLGAIVSALGRAFSLSFEISKASQNTTSDIAHRNDLFKIAIASQFRLLASTDQMKEALSAATEYGMDLDDTFQSELENLVKVNVALGISGMEAAKLDRGFRAVGTNLIQVSKTMANIKENSFLTGQEIAGIAQNISNAALGSLNLNADLKGSVISMSAGEKLMKAYGQPVGQLTNLFSQMSDITEKGNLSFMFGMSPQFMGQVGGVETMLTRMSGFLETMQHAGPMAFQQIARQLGLTPQSAAVLATHRKELLMYIALQKRAAANLKERNSLDVRYQNLLIENGEVWKNLSSVGANLISGMFGSFIKWANTAASSWAESMTRNRAVSEEIDAFITKHKAASSPLGILPQKSEKTFSEKLAEYTNFNPNTKTERGNLSGNTFLKREASTYVREIDFLRRQDEDTRKKYAKQDVERLISDFQNNRADVMLSADQKEIYFEMMKNLDDIANGVNSLNKVTEKGQKDEEKRVAEKLKRDKARHDEAMEGLEFNSDMTPVVFGRREL